MTYRTRTLLIVATGLAASVALALVVSVLVVRHSFLELEEESIRGDVDRAVKAVDAAVDEVDTIAADWATWDDTYAFVETGDPGWTSNNLVPESLAAIRIAAVVVADRTGRVVLEYAFDPATLAAKPVPPQMLELLAAGGPLARQADADGGRSGLLRLPGRRTALVAARPILTSSRQGPSRGTLLMARAFDAREVERLARLTSLALTLRPLDPPGLATATHQAGAVGTAQTDVLVERVDRETVAGSTVLGDIEGRPAMLLRVEAPRSVVRLGQQSQVLMGAMMLITGLVLGSGILLHLERGMRSLEGEVAERQRAEEQARRAEARYRHTVDNAIEGFYRTTLEGRFELVNPALAQILGFDSVDELARAVIGTDYRPYVDPERRKALLHLVETLNRVIAFESELYRKDGSVILVSENVSAVRDESGRLIGLEGSLVDVSEQKRSARDLQASETRYRELADSLPQPVFELDADAVPVYVNHAALTWYGSEVSPLLEGGKILLELVIPEQRQQAHEVYTHALAGERTAGLELTAVRGDGSRAPVLVFASPVERDGAPAGARILAVDISARKAAEAALRDSEQRQKAIIRSLPVAVYTAEVPSDLDATWMSDSVERVTGFPAARFLSEPRFWSSRIHPDDAARVAREYRLGAARGEVMTEYRWRVADGSYRWFVDSALCTRMQDGRAEMTGIIRDMTVEKEAEEAVRHSERYYRGLFDGAHDAILVFDPETEEVLDANQTACAVYRLPRSELVGMSLESVSKDVDAGKKRINETLACGSLVSFETVQLRGDGTEVVFEVNASVVEYLGRPAILSVNRDVTERRALEERLRQAEKMEALGRLAAGVAHDFNNVLAVILGATELILGGSDAGVVLRGHGERIRHAALRGRELVQSLLGFSRRQILQRQNVDLGAAVKGMVPILHGALPANINLSVVVAETPTTVYADQGQVEQILLNLTVNARDAMPDGGALEIDVEPVVLGDDFIVGRPWARAGRYGRLRVKDTGAGMDETVLARAFDPFFTTKAGTGTGLGLTSVYGIAKQHGGFVEIASRPGHGTVVDVYLPVGEGPAARTELRLAASAPATGHHERILLVEDEPSLREVAGELLSDLGYDVVAVDDGLAALAAIADATEPFALVMTDLTMPRMGGLELYQATRQRGLTTRFLFTSGHDKEAGLKGLPSGPRVAFLRKPSDLATLATTLRSLLDDET